MQIVLAMELTTVSSANVSIARSRAGGSLSSQNWIAHPMMFLCT
jgi:hypothetical protein